MITIANEYRCNIFDVMIELAIAFVVSLSTCGFIVTCMGRGKRTRGKKLCGHLAWLLDILVFILIELIDKWELCRKCNV